MRLPSSDSEEDKPLVAGSSGAVNGRAATGANPTNGNGIKRAHESMSDLSSDNDDAPLVRSCVSCTWLSGSKYLAFS